MNHAIIIRDLSVAYYDYQAIHDVSCSIQKGTLTAIIGPNGAGKSTLVKTIMGFLTPSTGTILIHNTPYNIRSGKIAYIPQRSSVDWNFPATCLDIVLMGCYGKLHFGQNPGEIERELSIQALEQVNMVEYAHTPVNQLSGGQQQRLFIARALVQNPDIYLLDEPFIGVDITTETIIYNLFQKLKTEHKTIIVVHHDLLTVKKYFNDVILLNKTIINHGPVAQILTHENIIKIFPHYSNHIIDITS